jgi:hypothetical protein
MLCGMTKDPYRYIPMRRTGSPQNRPADALIRVAVASLIAHVFHRRGNVEDIDAVLERTFNGDEVAPMLLRAATVPATTTTAGWADSAANASFADFNGLMGAAFVAPALFSRGLQLNFGPSANVIVPGLATSASNTSFVLQGAPIPVRQMTASAPAVLTPHKFATLIPFTREIVSYSTPSIVALVKAALIESVGLATDVAGLGTAAGSDTVVAGLRNGISAGTQSANANLYEAMLEDLGTVTAAVAAVAGSNPIAVIASPARAIRLKLRLQTAGDVGFEIFGSNGVGANEIVAIATNGIVSACDPVPRFDVSDQGTLVMDDAATPGQLVVGASTASGPARSLWQTDSIALRMVWECSWARRSDTAVSWLGSVTW